MQAGKPVNLCTSCEGSVRPVEGEGKPSTADWKAAWAASIRAEGVRNGLPARIFTVDIRARQRRIQNGQVSQLSHSQFFSRFRLGTKETCEERL